MVPQSTLLSIFVSYQFYQISMTKEFAKYQNVIQLGLTHIHTNAQDVCKIKRLQHCSRPARWFETLFYSGFMNYQSHYLFE